MANFILRTDCPCILIDTSYYVFYRFFDSWKKFRGYYDRLNLSLPSTEKVHETPYFLKQVYNDMNSDFCEMLRFWHTVPSNLIFCKDCSRSSIWRNEHTDDYKSKRPMKQNFTPHMFSIVSQYCKDRRFQEMSVAQLEADDLVALTKKRLRDAGFQSPIIIITNDNDYLQLLDENTHVYNMNPEKNNLRDRSLGDPTLDLKVKIIMGDRSDNIPPIKPNIGPKKALKLAQLSDADFQGYLATNQCKDAFEKNRQLIDFNAIRADLRHLYESTTHFQLLTPKYNVH